MGQKAMVFWAVRLKKGHFQFKYPIQLLGGVKVRKRAETSEPGLLLQACFRSRLARQSTAICRWNNREQTP